MKTGNHRLIILILLLLMAGAGLSSCIIKPSDDPGADPDQKTEAEAYFIKYGCTITIVPVETSIEAGKNVQFQATAAGGIFKLNITKISAWTSSDTKVAIIDRGGKATGMNEGSATITGKFLTKSFSAKLNVTAPASTIGPKCIASLSQWKIKYRTDTLSCTQCHTTCVPNHLCAEGAPWRTTNCSTCHDEAHEGSGDD